MAGELPHSTAQFVSLCYGSGVKPPLRRVQQAAPLRRRSKQRRYERRTGCKPVLRGRLAHGAALLEALAAIDGAALRRLEGDGRLLAAL